MTMATLIVQVSAEEAVRYYHGTSPLLTDLTNLAHYCEAEIAPKYRDALIGAPRLLCDHEVMLLRQFEITALPLAQKDFFLNKLVQLTGVELLAVKEMPAKPAAAAPSPKGSSCQV